MKLVRTSLWFLWLLTFSLLLFPRGFLLTKKEVEKFSSCLDYPLTPDTGVSCWSRPRYKRAILLLVDALRHDFTLYNDSITNPESWQNKMPVFRDLAAQFPTRTRHMEFIADPPSATFLRLKGLTTGGLPTFVDLGSNFGASEITEDSWVKQLSLNDKKLVLLGDDTWMNIYSQYFHRAFPYPSFDVWDLHTVDNGVWEHLIPQMHTTDWDVIVAHFLGVDHAGHRYHVNHPELADKLVQINSWIGEVVSHVDNDTILFIFGDHGMTSSGDHGGETRDEVTSSLFVYSGSDLGVMSEAERELFSRTRVFQTDLVPTLTLLLGVPIPYSSLGSVLPFLFLGEEEGGSSRVHLQHIINTNMNQVFRYISTYSQLSAEFSPADVTKIREEVKEINTRYRDDPSRYSLELVSDMLRVISRIRELCSTHWAQFNLVLMAFALLVMIMFSLFLGSTQSVTVYWWSCAPIIPILLISYDRLSLWVGVTHPISVMVTLASAMVKLYRPVKLKLYSAIRHLDMSALLHVNNIVNSTTAPIVASVVIIAMMSIGFTTNSYILVEDYSTIFFFATLLLINYISLHGFSYDCDHALYTFISLLCSRLSAAFFGCREEQFWCTKTWWLQDDLSELATSRRYFGSVCVFAGMMYGLYRYQKRQGALVSGMLRFIHRFIHPVQCTLVAVYWALCASPTEMFTDSQLCTLPLSVYLLTILSVTLILYSPSCVLVQTVRLSEPPRLYGGVSCYSAPSLTLYTSLLPSCALLLRQALSPTLALLTVQLLCLSRVLHDRSVAVKLTACHVISVQYFYATGHQAAVQQFDWNAAFVGFTSHTNHVIPALLIVLRTMMCSVLVTLSLPTILLHSPSPRYTAQDVDMTSQSEPTAAAPHTAQLQYYTDPHALPRLLHTTLRLSTLLLLVKCAWCCLACYVHRRHLMIWNIFTPRMITEACLSVSVSVSLVGLSVLMSRTKHSIGQYLDHALKSK